MLVHDAVRSQRCIAGLQERWRFILMGVPKADTKGMPVSCLVMWTGYIYGDGNGIWEHGRREAVSHLVLQRSGRGPLWWLIGLILEVLDVSKAF